MASSAVVFAAMEEAIRSDGPKIQKKFKVSTCYNEVYSTFDANLSSGTRHDAIFLFTIKTHNSMFR